VKWERDRRSSSGGKPNQRLFSVRSAGIVDILCRCGMLRNCWRNAAWKRSYDGLALGAALWSRTGAAAAAPPQANQQIMARGRDVRSSKGPLVLPVSCHRFRRGHDRLSAVSVSRCRCCQTSISESAEPSSHPQPRVINTDLAPIYGSAIPDIKKDGVLRRRCRHRPVQYLNNILEQDHRAIKRRVNAKQGFREFQAARRTIQGYEAIHMIRKGQVRWVSGTDVRCQIQFINKLFELPA
jgi:hypothetical protein